jgi:biotin carboxyl carrier protein
MSRPMRVEALDEGADAGRAVDLDPADPRAPALDDLGAGRVRIRDGGVDGRADGGGDGPDRRAVVARLAPEPDGRARVEVVVDGWRFELAVEDAARARLRRRATRTADAAAASGSADIRAIIPGRIAAVRVTAGDEVAAGQTLLVVEAMKMQNELRAPREGTIERVAVGEGQTIDRGDLLVVLR